MKIDKLYTLQLNGISQNQNSNSFVKGVLVDQNLISFETHPRYFESKDNEPYPYIHGIKDHNANRRSNPSFDIPEFDKNNLKDAKFYRTPKLALPQNKMQLLKDKYNVKVVRDIDKADYVITSDRYFESLTQYYWYDYYSATVIKEQYLPKIKTEVSEFIYNKISDFVNHAEREEGFIQIHARFPYNFGLPIATVHRKLRDGHCFWMVKDAKNFNFLLDNSDKLVRDSQIVNYCNEDSVILSPEECKSISQMIQSGEKDTMSLALEMMANCNVEKSYDKIALIFAFYRYEITNANNWNSVNIKSLRKQFDEIPGVDGSNGWGFNQLVRCLHAKKMLTPFAVGAISNKMCKTILSNVGLTSEESVFDIKAKDLKLKPEYVEDLPF